MAMFSKIYVLWEHACFPVCVHLLFQWWWNYCLLLSLLLLFNMLWLHTRALTLGLFVDSVGFDEKESEREREEERRFNQTKIQICKWSSNCSKWKQIVTKYDKECIFILYLGNLWMLMRLLHLFPWTMTLHCRECCMNIYSSSFSSCLDCKCMDYLSWSE